MNSTTGPNRITFFDLTKEINQIFVILIIIFGILGNSITILLLTFRCKTKTTNKKSIWHRSFSSSQYYMLFLALSDLVFLLSHLFEDILPSLSNSSFFQLVNLNTFFCKFILTIRNAVRLSSSYIIVLFAWER